MEKSTKEIIIEILAEDWPLTAKKIYYKIKKKGKKATYQAVFKSLNQLAEEGVIEKNKYNYSLNKEWISERVEFYEDLKKNYFGEYKNLPQTILKKHSLILTFNNLYKMLMAEARVITKLNFLTRKEGYSGYGEFNQLHWPFAAGEKENKLISKMFQSYKKIYIVCGHNNLANQIVYKYYKTFSKNIHLKFNKKFGKDYDMFIGGNIVAQIYYTKSFRDQLDKSYSKMRCLGQGGFNELYKNLFLKKTKITVVITRNPELAKFYKEKITENFK